MDFSLDEHQEALRQLAGKICQELATPARIRALETSGDWYDLTLWRELAKSELLGIALPSSVGGSGLGLLELCLLLEQVGRHVAPVPALATLVMGALPVAEFGTSEQQTRLLVPVARGEAFLTAALLEAGSDDPARPRMMARRHGGEWRLSGVRECVPAAFLAHRILVPARTGEDTLGVFLVDPGAAGVSLERQVATHREPQARLTLEDVAVPDPDVLGDPSRGAEIVTWLVERTTVGLCATVLGVVERALEMAAAYTSARQQFDRAIATFQAVAQRAADAWIDVQAVRLTTLLAAWRLSEGLTATREVAVAKFWAAEGGHRVAYAAQHLHGGIGVDIDYPLHRHYLWVREAELTLGGATQQLARLGRDIATTTDAMRPR